VELEEALKAVGEEEARTARLFAAAKITESVWMVCGANGKIDVTGYVYHYKLWDITNKFIFQISTVL
jgi:hypothetical protein